MIALLVASVALAGEPVPVDRSETGEAWALSAGWFGELLTHPGLFIGADRPLIAGRRHALVGGGRFAAYTHPRHHTGLLLRPELGWRGTAGFGLYGEALAGVGVHHRFLAGPLYVEREGELRKTIDLGRPSLVPGVALGLGWDLDRRGELPVRVFARADGWVRAPVNGATLPGLAVSLGASVRLGGPR